MTGWVGCSCSWRDLLSEDVWRGSWASRWRLEETRLNESGCVLTWPAYSCRCLTILSTLNRTVSQSHSDSLPTNLSIDLDSLLERSMFPTLFF